MKRNQILIHILHSIKEVRLDSDNNLQVKFNEPDPTYPDGWESISGYDHRSFTEQLLLLIEEDLRKQLPRQDAPSPNGCQPTT